MSKSSMSLLRLEYLYHTGNFSVHICLLLTILYTTLSGRTGGYPDDDLIKLKKKKKSTGSNSAIPSSGGGNITAEYALLITSGAYILQDVMQMMSRAPNQP